MSSLTLGPILFNWSADKKRDFYFRVADEAPVDTVCIGEVICSKRAPLFEHELPTVIDRLERAEKTVVLSTLAEVVTDREVAAIRELCDSGYTIEVNDATALHLIEDRPHRIGPFFNAYNEQAFDYLARNGARTISLNPELPGDAVKVLAEFADERGVSIEVQVFGRAGLALSARCYHARAYGLRKDTCQYVCEKHPDGMSLLTMDGSSFLAVNGVQTLSFTCLNLAQEMSAMADFGVSAFRLSPHDCDMVDVARIFRDLLDEKISAGEACRELEVLAPAGFANGFFHRSEGHRWLAPGNAVSSGN